MPTATAVSDETLVSTTWLSEAFAENPDQIFEVDPFDDGIIIVDPKNNSRGYTPEIGSKELSALIEDMEEKGQTTPGFATLSEDGRAVLYAGFRRLRAIQTMAKTSDGKSMYRLIVTNDVLTEQEMFERSLSENAFRTDMTIMQRVAALERLTGGEEGLSLTAAAKKMNMSKAQASPMLRFSLFPVVAKKALNNGNLGYKAAEKLVSLLPSAAEIASEPEDQAGQLLTKAQEKIAKEVERLLAKEGKVSSTAVDKSTRKMADSTGKQANQTQRRASLIVSEIEEYKASKPDAPETMMLLAFKKYVNGGSMKSLVKALTGE